MITQNLSLKKAVLKSTDKEEFIKSHCCLSISVGQATHENEYFRSTIESVSKSFKKCTIIIGDTLQRHNLQILNRISKQEAEEKTRQSGIEWYNRNSFYINTLSCPYKILYWDYWKNHENYHDKYQLIQNLYNSDEFFVECVRSVVNEFLDRNISKLVLNYKEAFDLGKEYLFEECASMLLWAKEGIHFDIYPSHRNKAMDFIYQNIISYFNPKLVRAVRIKFRNRLAHKKLVSEN